MYPFRSAPAWWIKGRHAHLVAIVQAATVSPGFQPKLKAAARRLRQWGQLRAAITVLLSLGAITAGLSLVAAFLPYLDDVQPFLARLAATAGAWTGLLGLAYLFATRTMGQLEVDILGMLALHAERPATPVDKESPSQP